jgi:hypothetical protein
MPLCFRSILHTLEDSASLATEHTQENSTIREFSGRFPGHFCDGHYDNRALTRTTQRAIFCDSKPMPLCDLVGNFFGLISDLERPQLLISIQSEY